MSQRLDIVIFGATGFTGQYTVEEIHRITKTDPALSGLTWGIAGRSKSKLEKIMTDLQKKTGDDLSKVKIILSDVKDQESLKSMTNQAKVLVNCCGPYTLYGEPVIKACIDTKTHQVDVTGESAYMVEMQLKYNDAAKKAGIYIISACAFDSIPADLGAVFLSQQFKGQLNSVESYMSCDLQGYTPKLGEALVHYGTYESFIYILTNMKQQQEIEKKLYPNKFPDLKPKLGSRYPLHKSKIDDCWHVPYIGPDDSVTYRTQRYFHEVEKKRPIQINLYGGLPNLLLVIGVFFMAIIFKIFSMFAFGRSLLLNYPRLFSFGIFSHEGPSEELMKSFRFTFNMVGKGWDETVKDVNNVPPNKTMQIQVTGTNPAYGATCTAVLCSAITILKEADKMPKNVGVISPGAAFAKTSLVSLLSKNNLKFEVVSTHNKAD